MFKIDDKKCSDVSTGGSDNINIISFIKDVYCYSMWYQHIVLLKVALKRIITAYIIQQLPD